MGIDDLKQTIHAELKEAGFENLANTHFSRIDESRTNFELLIEILNIPNLTRIIVERLEREEQEDRWAGCFQDEDIKKRIGEECAAKQIPLPSDQDQRQKWIYLIYITAARIEEFSYGNILRACDVTGEPDPELE